jgi:hypothetical protein
MIRPFSLLPSCGSAIEQSGRPSIDGGHSTNESIISSPGKQLPSFVACKERFGGGVDECAYEAEFSVK